jgi:hypothetical protein
MMTTVRPFSPYVPADAGTRPLPNPQDMRFIKGWIPASAGMSGGTGSLVA